MPKNGCPAATKRQSRKAAIRYIDGMARQVFAKAVEDAESNAAVLRLEALVQSWRPQGR